MSVCLSLAAFLHHYTDADVTLGNGRGCPYSCALLGRFAIGALVTLLWQHTRLMRNVSEDACTRCMYGCVVSVVKLFKMLNAYIQRAELMLQQEDSAFIMNKVRNSYQ